jgi:hypothetical protein
MAKTPVEKFNLQKLIDKAVEGDAKPYRSSNIGASTIGCPCQRSTFLTFRWASPMEKFSGQMLRLFDVGTREEGIMVNNLKKIGFDVRYTGIQQLKLQIAPHLICRPDGVIYDGIPEQEVPVNFECKTMNKNNFDKLEKQGLRNYKPEYYDQAQCEMYGESNALNEDVSETLFVALCKDDSRIYAEIIRYDEERMNLILKNAENIVFGNTLPEEYSIDPEMTQCKYCNNSVFCHVTHETREVNCRTCAFSKPEIDSTWTCSVYPGSPIPYDAQMKGCQCHAMNPLLVPYRVDKEKSKGLKIAYVREDGEIVYNGYGGIPSKDLWKHMIVEKVDDGADPLSVTFK